MTISGNISVPSATFENVVVSVSGTSALNYATAFANVLNGAAAAGTLLITDLDTPFPAPGSASGDTLEYTVLNAGETGTIGQGGTYVFDHAAGNTTVSGSGLGDTVLAASAGGSGGMTYLDQGGDNNILFVSGNNTYLAAVQGLDTPADTITAGSGQDSITTGPAPATVFSGTGHATITLRDNGLGGGTSVVDDTVVLNDGQNTVNAFGVSDLIVASAPGQVINGGANAAATDQVVISAGVPGAGGNDLLNAGAGNFTITDSAGGNSIVGGTGLLTLIANPAVSGTTLRDTITSAGGAVDMFGASGSMFTLLSAGAGRADLFVAGLGSETLAAASATNTLILFGNSAGSLQAQTGAGLSIFVEGQDTDGSTVYDKVAAGTGELEIFGGSGNNLTLSQGSGNPGILYVAGADNETVQASAASAPMTVFGGDGGSLLVQGGSSHLSFVGGTSFAEVPAATVTAGAGGATLFGNDGDVLTLTSIVTNSSAFVAGMGNETLDGSGSSGFLTVFGYNPGDPIAGGNVNESVIGGSGVNSFVTGAGYETFVAGSGANAFQIDKTIDGLGGTITIYNYNSSDVISFHGFTTAEEQAAIKTAAPATNGIVGTQITLSDQTTVLFVDASASSLTFKV
jgi:Ca2+-binding RTX toxin-like protein